MKYLLQATENWSEDNNEVVDANSDDELAQAIHEFLEELELEAEDVKVYALCLEIKFRAVTSVFIERLEDLS